jgi:hypothetical protein
LKDENEITIAKKYNYNIRRYAAIFIREAISKALLNKAIISTFTNIVIFLFYAFEYIFNIYINANALRLNIHV